MDGVARQLSITGAIDNLADSNHMEPLGYPAFGRAVRLGIRTTFLSARTPITSDICRAGHPVWRRCSSLTYSRYARSSRLASRAPRSGILSPCTSGPGLKVPIRPRAAISWSGGKDSLAALAAVRDQLDVVAALTMFDESGERSRSHGLRPALIEAQADRLGLRPAMARCTWETYDEAFRQALVELAADGVTHVVFGDLVFAEHRKWAEDRCAEAGLEAVEPLWGLSTSDLFDAFVASGAQAWVVTVREPWLDESWLGRPLHADMKDTFILRGIDPCWGENGEYHTAVIDSPLFSSPIMVSHGERVRRGACVALDLIPDAARD